MSEQRAQTTTTIVGEMLGNHRVLAELGRGGMGTIYRAEHALLGRPAAIKLLHPELTRSAELVRRFFHEAKAATAIRHPGIVEVYDFGYTEDGQAYLVMELLEGEPLGARLARRGRLPEAEAAQVARGIASALRAAHDKGIFHRDLKPDNVFLIPDPEGAGERVKVLDFGVAKLGEVTPGATRFTRTGALMGTPLYMAPEQARAAATVDQRADLYSLGCILYELLVGAPPFTAVGAGEVIALQMFGTVEPPRQRVPGLTPGIEAIVMRLLEKEPDARYADARELQQALARLEARSADVTDLARAPTEAVLVAPPAPPRRGALPMVAGVVVLALVGGVGAFVALRGPDTPAPSPASPPAVTPVAAPKPDPTHAPEPAPVEAALPDVIVEDSGERAPPRRRATRPRRDPARSDQAIERTPGYRGAAVTPRGLVTDKGSPIEVDLDPYPTAPARATREEP